MSKENRRVRLRSRRSLWKHEAVEGALVSWSKEIDHLRSIGRENKAEKLEAKLKKLQGLDF